MNQKLYKQKSFSNVLNLLTIMHNVSYYKSKLELKSNLAKFCQLIASLSGFISCFFALKVRLKDLKFELCQFKLE